MTGLQIDFQRIRPHRGTQHHGFEELCCQIASLEPRPTRDVFHRKGLGADAGVECFVKHANGTETGWQAKWFFEFGNSQIAQLGQSINQALTKHPRLTKYIVCLPIDLRDARLGKRSELERWQAWVKKWEKKARQSNRSISIELWNASLLIQRLTQNNPLHAGRLRYWFDHTVLDPQWFKQRFAESRAGLGERYTPETNVDLPIRRALLAFGRNPVVTKEIEGWLNKLEELRHRAINTLDRHLTPDNKQHVGVLENVTGQLSSSLSAVSGEPDAELPLDEWRTRADRALEASHPCIEALRSPQIKGGKESEDTRRESEDTRYAIHSLYQLTSFLHEFAYAFHDDRWRIVNSRRLLVFGEAGVGKSHLFGDAVQHCVDREQPALLILGSSFTDADPWSQILDLLGLQNLDRDTFLGALDAAAQAVGTRAVLLIDAINERKGLDVWPTRLAGFLQGIDQFPRVGIALSCRSSYLPFLINASIDEKRLPRIEHIGFAGRAGEAAQVYLDRRGIVRMAAPNLVPEFENPLFLKTCCDYLQKEGLNEFPRGLRGVTKIFEFYFTAVARQIENKLKLDPAQKIVARSVSALAEAADQSERGYVPKDVAHNAVEAIFPSQGLHERSLLALLASEGVLSVEPVHVHGGSSREYVRFTFERYSDHRIAAYLLDAHLDPARPSQAFTQGTPLHSYVTGPDAYSRLGVIEAMAIQLPERSESELPDVVPSKTAGSRWILQEAFRRSVLWRNQKCFRKRTLELLHDVSKQTGEDEATRVLIAVATEPENEFNALYLHDLLWKLPMPERDQHWSTYIAQEADSEGSPIQTLIAWITHNGQLPIEDNRAELAAITLSWFFASSHRGTRDCATKALATLLSVRLPLAAALIRRFAPVDDPYVLDRVLAAAYGGALQGSQTDGLGDLAAAAFDAAFSSKEAKTHVLIRDHARGIIELAHARGVLPADVDIAKARPPYRSSWPLKDVAKRTIEKYREKYPSGTYQDAIVGSCVSDGDFARYEIDPTIGHWSSLPIAAAGKTEERLFSDWMERALRARPKAEGPFRKLIGMYDRLRDEEERNPRSFFATVVVQIIDPKNPRKKRQDRESRSTKKREAVLAKLDAQLKSALGMRWWAEYCLYARSYVQRDLYSLSVRYHWPPRFDSLLVRRWVCKRAHDIGWTPDRFSAFDRNLRSSDRNEHRVERIGKKYQWIALCEAAAHLADNAAFIGGNRDELTIFQGPWQVGMRDIDPSVLATESFGDSWRSWGPTWWMPAKTHLQPVSLSERLLWLDSDADFWNDSSLLAVTDPKTDQSWFVLDEYVGFTQWGREKGERTYDRTAFFAINCLLVRATERKKLIAALSGRILFGSHDLPSVEIPDGSYLGEHFWHPLHAGNDGWAAPDTWHKIPVPTQPMNVEYSAKQSEFDYSLEKSFSVKLPAPGLSKELGLRLSNGRKISYVDAAGKLLFFDPSIKEEGPSAALVERTAFLEFLNQAKLEAVWIVSSKKETFSGRTPEGGWGGERTKCSLYWLTPNGFAHRDHEERRRPTAEQLRRYWGNGEQPIPSAAAPPSGKPANSNPQKTRRGKKKSYQSSQSSRSANTRRRRKGQR